MTSADALSRIPLEKELEQDADCNYSPVDDYVNDTITMNFQSLPADVIVAISKKSPFYNEVTKAVKSCPDFQRFYDYLLDGKLPDNDVLAKRTVF